MDTYPRATPDAIQYDDVLIGHNAATPAERTEVLSQAVNLTWAGDDVGKIERFEPAGPGAKFYLAMWRYKAGNTQ